MHLLELIGRLTKADGHIREKKQAWIQAHEDSRTLAKKLVVKEEDMASPVSYSFILIHSFICCQKLHTPQ